MRSTGYNSARVWRSIAPLWAGALLCASLSAQPAAVRAIHEGIAVEFDFTASESAPPSDVNVRFRISETATGNSLPGLRPAAWLNLRQPGREAGTASCSKKIASFLSNSLLSLPTVDLNAWYVLAMNENASISVVNPRFGFGGSQLLSLVVLDSPGEDWALTEDQQRLFVSMPAAGSVAAVDTVTWKITARLPVPNRPGRLALQPGDRLLWVASRTEAIAYDRQTLQLAGRIPLGAGTHEIAFAGDGGAAFITNSEGGSVTVIDTATLRKISDVAVGSSPASIAFSPLARMVYVAHAGGITVLNEHGGQVSRIPAGDGISQVRPSPGGRYLFAVNPGKDQVHIVETSSNRIVQTSTIHGGPDQVTFSSTLAYIRRRTHAAVLVVPLDKIGTPGASLPIVEVATGQLPFSQGTLASPAHSITPVPGANAALVANPADRAVYYYEEGMAAPMGHFANYGHEPRALLTIDRGLEERPRGEYQSTGRVPKAGIYDVAFFLDSPRVIHCFELEVKPANKAAPGPRPVSLRALPRSTAEQELRAGTASHVRFQVLDARTQTPITNIGDLRALVFLQPGIWQTRQLAAETAPGVYELQFTPPSAGVYQAYFNCPSLGLRFNSPQVLTFQAATAATDVY